MRQGSKAAKEEGGHPQMILNDFMKATIRLRVNDHVVALSAWNVHLFLNIHSEAHAVA